MKSVAWFLVGVIALLAIVLIAIQTPIAKKQIVRIAETQANKILNAELSIGMLSGNFFTNLALHDITLLSLEEDTVASIDKLQLNYRLLALLKGEILAENVAIENPYLYLTQLPDSSWNVMHLVKPSEDEPNTTPSSFDMLVRVNQFILNNGFVQINAFEKQIPDEIKDFYIALSGFYSTDKQQLSLSDFRFKTANPALELVALNLTAEGDTSAISLNDLLLRTVRNEISGNGAYHFSTTEKSHFELTTQPIVLDEFKAFLPDSFHFAPKPELNLNVELENKNIHANILIKDNDQTIDFKMLSFQLLEYLSDTAVSPVIFDLALTLEKIDLRYWLDNPKMNYQLGGVLTLVTEGLDPQTMRANVDADFGELVVDNNSIEHLRLKLNYLAGNLNGDVLAKGDFGSLYLVPQVQNLLGDNPKYKVNLTTQNLDASALLGEEYKSDVNLTAAIKGYGFELDKMNATGEIALQPSSAMGVQVDKLDAQFNFAQQNIVINRFLAEALGVNLQASGNYNLIGKSNVALNAKMDSAQQISRFVGVDSLETSLNLVAYVTGQMDNLNADLQLGLGETRFQEIKLDSVKLIADAQVQNNDIRATANLNAHNLNMTGISLDDIHLQVETDTKNYVLALQAQGKDIQTQLTGIVQLGDAIRVALSDLMLGYKTYVFQQVSDTAHINIGAADYEIRDFHLLADSAGLRQSIYADGKISRTDSQDFKLDISNLNIKQLLEVLGIEEDVSGFANLNMSLEGEAASPQLSATLHVDSTALGNYRFDTLWTNIDLRNKELLVNLNVVPRDSGHIQAEGKLPVNLRLDSMQFDFMPKETDSIYAKLFIHHFPLSIAKVFVPANEISGKVNSNIKVDGIVKQPKIAGNLKIDDGKLIAEQYGIKYKLIQADIQIEEDEVTVDTFLIKSTDGNMIARGGVKFNSELYNADLNSSQLAIKFNKFNPFDHKQFNMQMSGNVNLKADADSVRFSGGITVPEAYVYLPAIMNLLGQFSTPDIAKPLLVKEMERMSGDTLIYSFRPSTTVADTIQTKFDFLNNLQGDIKVEIPRNTWIRNDDMRIELSGDVQVMKHRDFFEIFGTIDIVRGQYNLLGKVFVIQTGTVSFHGGEKIDPILNIDAIHSFRDSYRNKRDLAITITGGVDNLLIKFNLDDANISEGDALSYILFGMSMDELTSGQQSALGSSMDAAGIAETAAASLISSQVSKFLGNTGLVDYVDINVGSSFDSGSLTVGKYITNKLFMSYEQHIGTIEDKDVARYEVRLEYELFKFLFLQLSSSPITHGFDLIFKVNSKVK